jgi:hypothetical protein
VPILVNEDDEEIGVIDFVPVRGTRVEVVKHLRNGRTTTDKFVVMRVRARIVGAEPEVLPRRTSVYVVVRKVGDESRYSPQLHSRLRHKVWRWLKTTKAADREFSLDVLAFDILKEVDKALDRKGTK